MPSKIALISRVGFHDTLEKNGASRIRHQVVNTPFGKSNPIHSMIFRQIPFYVVSRHGENGYDKSAPFVDMRANLYALKKKGVEKIVSISAPGSLSEKIKVGSIVVPHDMIDRTYSPHRTFFENRGIGVIRMNEVFCPSVRALLITELETNFVGETHNEGIYICTAGPRLETPAEIKDYTLLGGAMVGMTLSPEAFLARELELCYASFCYPVNFAEGVAYRPYKPDMLFEGLATEDELKTVEKVEEAIPQIALNLIPKLDILVRDCYCSEALRRYKTRGDLPEDFNKWF